MRESVKEFLASLGWAVAALTAIVIVLPPVLFIAWKWVVLMSRIFG